MSHFDNFEQVKIIICFADLRKSKILTKLPQEKLLHQKCVYKITIAKMSVLLLIFKK